MKRTCLVATLLREKGTTGVQTHIRMAADVLKERGFEVVVVTPFSGRRYLRVPVFGLRYLLQFFSTSLEVFWYRYGHYLYLLYALRTLRKQGRRIDVVYAQCPLSARAALEVFGADRIPVMLIVHFNGSQAFEWLEKGKIAEDDWVYRKILREECDLLPRVNCLVYVSHYMRQVLEERIPELKNRRNEVISNFIAGQQLVAKPVEGDLITIGTLEPRKNQGYLLLVLAELKRRGVCPTLKLVGGGQDRKRLEAMVVEHGLQAQVSFIGYRANAASMIGSYRLYVHSALMESFGIVLIEALSTATPIVAARAGGTSEILVDGWNGRFWNLGNVAEGADILQGLLEDDALRRRLGRQGRLDFELKFSFTAAGTQLSRLISEIA